MSRVLSSHNHTISLSWCTDRTLYAAPDVGAVKAHHACLLTSGHHCACRSRAHQESTLVAGEVVVVILCKAGVQVPVRQVNRAEAGRIHTLEEEVVDERVVIALVVHVVGVGYLLTSPAKCMLLQRAMSAEGLML